MGAVELLREQTRQGLLVPPGGQRQGEQASQPLLVDGHGQQKLRQGIVRGAQKARCSSPKVRVATEKASKSSVLRVQE